MTKPTTYGTATVTFAHLGETYDVVFPLLAPVDDVEDLDGSELAWEAAEIWPEADWHLDKPTWGVVKVTVTIDGETIDITPREF